MTTVVKTREVIRQTVTVNKGPKGDKGDKGDPGDGLTPQTAWNADTNDPDLAGTAPHQNGDFWLVEVAGNTNLNGITDWQVGDWAIWFDNEPGNWAQYRPPQAVLSVFGRIGAVTALAADYAAFYDSLGSAQAVQNALDVHVASIAQHADVELTNPQAGDLFLFDGANFVNAELYEESRGTIADSAVPDAAGPNVAYTEFVPTSTAQSDFVNATYAGGRIKIDYSGANHTPQTLTGLVIASMSVTMPTADTTVEISFAIDGVVIADADFIKSQTGNAGQQTAGTGGTLSLTLPFSLPDQSELSVFLRCNNAIVVDAFTLAMVADADKVVTARTS